MMTRILGIDPGYRVTGFGIIDFIDGRARYVDAGCIPVGGDDLAERLRVIFDRIGEITDTHRPQAMAVEKVFMHRNAAAALKLGQARGAAVLAGVKGRMSVHEYTPTEIKQAITGRGHAAKVQVQHMMRVLLALPGEPQSDAADALAVALCHAHTAESVARRTALVRASAK